MVLQRLEEKPNAPMSLSYKVVMSAIGSDSPSQDTLQNDQFTQLTHAEHVLLLLEFTRHARW